MDDRPNGLDWDYDHPHEPRPWRSAIYVPPEPAFSVPLGVSLLALAVVAVAVLVMLGPVMVRGLMGAPL